MYCNKILGGIVGDIIGSTRERKNIKTEDFELLPLGSHFTDDTVMTLAVAKWLLTDPLHMFAAVRQRISSCRLWWHVPQVAVHGESSALRKFW